ncbi:MAG: RluA family pseudouridine synthase [Clostridia bacterium]|nr:RluA family pseudouridine synthase [Clostridia bacterium]
MKLEYTNVESKGYMTVFNVLKNEFHLSDRLILKLKKEQQIYINGEPTHIKKVLNVGDIISADISFAEESENIVPTKMDLNILYEDDALLIINKKPNTPVHPSTNHYEDTLSNGVKYYFENIGLKRKIRPVNRLDKDTSGIVIFAKNEYIQECLTQQMKAGIFKKEYLAFVTGTLEESPLTLIRNIKRKAESIIERCVSDDEDSEYAETIFETIKEYDGYSLIKCILKTGRTHQIRVHTSYLGHSILGDTLYSTSSNLIARQALHAYKVNFIHPITKELVEITCDLPEDMQNLIS